MASMWVEADAVTGVNLAEVICLHDLRAFNKVWRYIIGECSIVAVDI